MTQDFAIRSARSATSTERLTNRDVVRRMTASFLVQGGGAGLGYVQQVVLATTLGVASYGRYAVVLGWCTVGASLTALGFPSSVMRFVPEYRAANDAHRLGALVRFSVRIVSGVSVACAILAVPVLGILHVSIFGSWSDIGAAALILVLIARTTTGAEIIRALESIPWSYGPTLVVRPLVIVAGVLAASFAFGLRSAGVALWVTACSLVFVTVLQWPRLRRLAGPSTFTSGLDLRRQWLSVSATLVLSSISLILVSQADLLIVGGIRGSSAAGLYGAAARTATLIALLGVAVSTVAAPRFAAEFQRGDMAELERVARVAVVWSLVPAVLIGVVFELGAGHLLAVFGPSFPAASTTLRVLTVGQLVSATAGPVGYLLSATGHHRDMLRVYGVCAVANIAAGLALTAFFGSLGAAVAAVVTLSGANIALLVCVRRRLGINPTVLFAPRAVTSGDTYA